MPSLISTPWLAVNRQQRLIPCLALPCRRRPISASDTRPIESAAPTKAASVFVWLRRSEQHTLHTQAIASMRSMAVPPHSVPVLVQLALNHLPGNTLRGTAISLAQRTKTGDESVQLFLARRQIGQVYLDGALATVAQLVEH